MSIPASAKPAPSGALRPAIALLVAVTAVNPMALNIYVPSMPSVQQAFGAPASLVQLTLSLGFIGTAMIQLIIGPLSDQLGRRPVLLSGLIMSVLASIFCTFSPDLNSLIVGRVIQTAGATSGLVLGRAIVRDIHEPSEAASMLGYVTMGMAMAPMIAPTLGGALDDLWSWRAGFAFSSVFSAIVLISAWYALPETAPNIGRKPSVSAMLSDYLQLMRIRTFWLFTVISALVTGTFFALLGGAPYVSHEIFHISPTQYGLYFMFIAVGYALGNFLSGRYASRKGIYRMLRAGAWVVLSACLTTIAFSLAGIETPLTLFGPAFFVGVGNGLTLPSGVAGIVSGLPRLAGSASGLSGSFLTLIAAIFSYFVTFMISDSVLPLSLFMSGSALVALILAYRVPKSF